MEKKRGLVYLKGVSVNKRIAFTGGGTAGHVFPGLSVAASLDGYELFWIGSSRGMERKLVEDAGIPFKGIPSGKLRRYFDLKNLTDLFRIAAGFFSSFRFLRRFRPELLFSKGGYVSVPPVLAARLLKIPVITHESDLTPGLATRINSRFADRILVSYDETRRFFPSKVADRLLFTGNPVRKEILEADRERGRRMLGIGGDDLLVLVLGGSQGALQINRLMAEIGRDLTKLAHVVHQTGPWEEAPQKSGFYRPIPFIGPELPDYLAAADLLISRAGASTLWEAAVQAVPMVLIPLGTGSSRGDQLKNSRLLAQAGAAEVLTGDVTPSELLNTVCTVLEDSEKRQSMGRAAAAWGCRDAAEKIAGIIRDTVS